MDDFVMLMVYVVFPVLFGVILLGSVMALVAVVAVPWLRRRSRVDRKSARP